MPRDEWLGWRRRGLGGSDAGAICGVNKYTSEMKAYLDKLNLLPPEEENQAAKLGRLLEPTVAFLYAEATGAELRQEEAIFQHDDHSWMLANIDRFVTHPERGEGLLEIKTTSAYLAENWVDDKVPDSYIAQCQHYMAVTGHQWCDIAYLIGGQKFDYKTILRDDELIQFLYQKGAEFWERVQKREPPPMTGLDNDLMTLLYPKAAEEKKIVLPIEAELLIAQHNKAAADVKDAEARKDEADAQLKALLGDAAEGIIGDTRVCWPTINASRFDESTFKLEHPELYAKYKKATPYRALNIRRVKN